MMLTSQKLNQLKQKGNSLTFLLASLAVISVSMTVGSIALAPIAPKSLSHTSEISAFQEVAQHHLELIQNYIKTHPVTLNQGTTANPNWNSASGGSQTLSQSAQDSIFGTSGANLETYTETLQLKNGGMEKVVSIMPSNSSGHYAVTRFMGPNGNGNQFQLTVETYLTDPASQASPPPPLSKITYVSHNFAVSQTQCDDTQAPQPVGLTLPTASDSNYHLYKISGPEIQIGDTEICDLPVPGQQPPLTSLNCITESGVDLLRADLLSIQGVSSYTANKTVYTLLHTNPYQIKIASTYYNGTTPNTPFIKTANLTNFDGNLNDIVVDTLPPQNGSSDIKSYIFYLDTNHNLQVSWTVIKSTGISTTAGSLFASGTNSSIQYGPGASPPSNQGNVDSFTYFIGSGKRWLVSTDSTNKLLHVTPLKTDYLDSTPSFSADSPSATPALSSPSSDLMIGSVSFGKPAVSKEGKFVVVPALISGTQLDILAFNTSNLQIGTTNNAYYAPTSTTKSNIASLITYTGLSDSTNVMNNLILWYNPDVQKFYWVTNALLPSGVNQAIFTWDPKSWGDGPNSGLTPIAQWYQNQGSLLTVTKNINFVGSQPAISSGENTGNYYTVRQVNLTVQLLGTSGFQMIYDPIQKDYYFRVGNDVYQFNLIKSKLTDIFTAGVVTGRSLALDPHNGALYISSASLSNTSTLGSLTSGDFYLYDSTHATYPPMRLLSQPGVTPPSFSSSSPGDGDLIYDSERQSLYYMQSGKLYAYDPYCIYNTQLPAATAVSYFYADNSYVNDSNYSAPASTVSNTSPSGNSPPSNNYY